MPAYLYWGEEEFNLSQAVDELKSKTLDENWAALNFRHLQPTKNQSSESFLSEIVENLETRPMVFGNFMLQIDARNLYIRGNKGEINDKLIKRFIENLENVPDNFYVLFTCKIERGTGKKIDGVSKLTKATQKVADVQEFASFKPWEEDKIANWIIQRAKQKKLKINTNAALTLTRAVGSDLRKLDIELEKLGLMAYPETEIAAKHVEKIAETNENTFLFADCLLAGNRLKALSELKKLMEKDHPMKIIATLQTTVRKWVKIKVEHAGVSSFELAKTLGANEYVVKKDLEKLRNVKPDDLLKLKSKLNECEFKAKIGELNPEFALEMLVIG